MARWVAAAVVVLALAAGCQGSDADVAPAPSVPTTEAAPLTSATEAPPATTAADGGTTDWRTMEETVRAWSDALNAGDNDAVARLFALPALIAQGDAFGQFRTYADLAAWFSGLPCSGTVVSVSFDGPDVALAVFELGDRSKTSPCDGPPGSKAAARFIFRDGKLIAWQQVPVPDEAPITSDGPQA